MERRRHGLERHLIQQWLGIEQIHLAGSAFHKTPDDVFRPDRVDGGLLGRERIHGGGVSVLRQHGRQRDAGQPAARLREELTPVGNVPVMFQLIEHWVCHGIIPYQY